MGWKTITLHTGLYGIGVGSFISEWAQHCDLCSGDDSVSSSCNKNDVGEWVGEFQFYYGYREKEPDMSNWRARLFAPVNRKHYSWRDIEADAEKKIDKHYANLMLRAYRDINRRSTEQIKLSGVPSFTLSQAICIVECINNLTEAERIYSQDAELKKIYARVFGKKPDPVQATFRVNKKEFIVKARQRRDTRKCRAEGDIRRKFADKKAPLFAMINALDEAAQREVDEMRHRMEKLCNQEIRDLTTIECEYDHDNTCF